jgi:uncharacterized protein GlcG (DUF336 family)
LAPLYKYHYFGRFLETAGDRAAPIMEPPVDPNETLAEFNLRIIHDGLCAIDVHGNVILKQRMTGAKLISIEMAERKAYTAAALDMKTADMSSLAAPGKALHTLASVAGGRYTVLGGGIPLRVAGQFLGGVGVSGGTTEQDTEIMETALDLLWRDPPS